MVRESLRALIKPQHLDDAALASCRSSFSAHPARLIVLRDFLVDPVAERLGAFLRGEAIFNEEFGLHSVEGAVSAERWAAAGDADRFFRMGKLAGTAPQHMMSPNALAYLRFRQAFQGDDMRAFFEAVSGLPLGWSDDFGAHRMRAGDFLRAHSDDNRNRRLALVLYLSPGWDRTFGGELQVHDGAGRTVTVEPEYNSIIAFDVLAGTTHTVVPVEPAAGEWARLTIGGWYHRAEGDA